jgi:transcriptional regulator with GAF, ATPase, and Fis domain
MRRMLPRIVGESAALQRVLVAIERVREVQTPVLLLGESGTGKELLAEAIHLLSPRAEGPFVRVNAAAFTDTLLLSELFGHEKGAFTGAHARRIGRFEAAHGGTLFLDEIGDVSERLQTALLRVLEEQRFQRVGGTETVHVDVRIVFATNRDLQALMKQGRFRQDLYHRISGISLAVPPLRERPEDIPTLVSTFLDEIGRDTGRTFVPADDALKLLAAWSWPGNIRELKNVLRRTCLMTDGEAVTRDAILRENPELRQACGRPVEGHLDAFDLVFGRGMSLFDARREMEVALIREALVQSGGNISAAAQMLGMKRPRLSQMVKEYGLKVQGVDTTLDSAKEAL